MTQLFGNREPALTDPNPSAAFNGSEIVWPLSALPGIRGSLNGIFGDEIRGWIVDEFDPNRYLTLCLILNGKFIEKTFTCIFRKDLEQLFGSKGLHGFSFRIPDSLQEQSELNVEIRLEDGRQLCEPHRVHNPSPGRLTGDSTRKPCLLMMHIPKTAGTAVRSALRNDWLTDRQIWLYGDAPGLPMEHIFHLTESQLLRVECIVGHFSFGFHSLLPQPATYATILREPVERCISNYFHERLKSGDPCNPARNLTLDELVHSASPSFFYDNLMVRMLTGMAPVPLGCVTRPLLQQAIENIHQSFCYIGLQNRTAEAVSSLAEYLSLQPNPLQIENLGMYDKTISASSSAIGKLRELNQFDLELFDYVQRRFWSTDSAGWVRGIRGQASPRRV